VVIDCHIHFNAKEGIDALRKTCDQVGIDKVVLFSDGENEQVLEAARLHPDFVIPFAFFHLGIDTKESIARLIDSGFKGLKTTNPPKRYDDESYFPLYEMAEIKRTIILFHLGIVVRPQGGLGKQIGVNCDHMRPVYLDTIARRFPDLTIIGAHLGNPWSDEAAMCCRWNPNLYFDFSGSLLKYREPQYLRGLLWWDRAGTQYMPGDKKGPFEKILFGTDVPLNQMQEVKDDYDRFFDAIQLSPELRQAVYGGNIQKLLKIED
jgi:predicted TIM-barrel fold metal-dependent hydrolase